MHSKNYLVSQNVFTYTDFGEGFVGLAITQSMRLNLTVMYGMHQLAVLENQIHSVERVLEYIKIPQEANIQSPQGNKKMLINIQKNRASIKCFFR